MKWRILLLLCITAGILLFRGSSVHADEYDDLGKQISDLQHSMSLITSANDTNKKQLTSLQQQIVSIQGKIDQAKKQASVLSGSIKEREATLGVTYERFNSRVAAQYENQQQDWSLTLLVSSTNIGQFLRDVEYRERVRQKDQSELEALSSQITSFERDKANLEATQAKLQSFQSSLDSSAQFLKGEIAKADKEQADIAGKIASLSARQQEILAERSGTASTTVGDVPLSDDPNSRPTFNPGFSPAFAAFSFGAPHFKGMSQYGAYGRAKAGQNAETILHAYYGGGIEIKKDYATNINIRVDGYGTVDIETYVKRIYEMPASWADNGGFEALKAQAVAARSYALASTNNGAGSICATEACQVYKPQNKGGRWDEAVDATRGWVLVAGGSPFSAWYASTSGGYQQSYTANGYSTPAFWDTTSDWSHFADGAYESKAGSPWFYKGWYKSRSGASCGQSNPWLTSTQMADILNAWQVLTNGGGDSSRISPVGDCWGGNPYSVSDLQGIGGFTDVSGVSVIYGNSGSTLSINFSTNKGGVTVQGSDFEKAFNLRAPGYIGLKSSLFNIEKL